MAGSGIVTPAGAYSHHGRKAPKEAGRLQGTRPLEQRRRSASIRRRVHEKRPRDPNQWAKRMVDIATGEVEDREPTPEEQGKDPAAVALGRRGGLKGGKARAEKLTPEQRSEAARKAASSRWRR
jgi:hypothetical protein